jgi:hypothetical protein
MYCTWKSIDTDHRPQMRDHRRTLFKSFLLPDTIISIVRNMTQLNDSILVGAPTGGAAFNVQGSTLHRLLGINVGRPEDVLSEATTKKRQVPPDKLVMSHD